MKKGLQLFIYLFLMVGAIQAQITSVGIIGSATPGGWDLDTNMVQDPVDTNLWTLTIPLVDGEAKFRTNDDWSVNWGETTFPFGTGVQDGPNIPVIGGDYTITFNSETGEYFFDLVSSVGIIGSATPFGWDRDVNMFPDTAAIPDTNLFFITLDLLMGEAKFRANDDWPVNWGAADFPTGIGVQDGPNIPIPKSGNYTITLDTSSGEYNFEENVTFSSVGIIGDATSNGWDSLTAMTQSANDPNVWLLSTELNDGGLQFSGNDGEIIWGADGFPMDTAVVDGDTIPITAGRWQIEFNTESGIYTFTEIQIFGSVGIIGDATPGGWDFDTDMMRSEADSSDWELRVILADGEAKFRADDDWAVNWGAGDFPTGIGIRDGANIPITAGEYLISFNSISGEYNFKELIVFDTIGLIGTGTPFGNWDDDVLLTKDPADENNWLLESVELSQDGEVKFREGLDWEINWGAEEFPGGIGTQDGSNIIITTGGTYGIVFNSISGEYAFGDPFTITSTQDRLDPSAIKAYPNPTSDLLNIDIGSVEMQGRVNLNVFDMKGTLLISHVVNATELMQVDVSSLASGQYAIQITNDKYIIGKRFSIVK